MLPDSKRALPRIRGRVLRWLTGPVLVGLAVAAITSRNAQRLGGDRFDGAGERLLLGARAVADRAVPGYEQTALASLPPVSANGWFRRLDDPRATEIAAGEVPEAGSRSGVLWSLEFDDADGLLSVPPGSPVPQVAAGRLRATSAFPVAVTHRELTGIAVDQIGEIQIAVRSTTSPQLVLGWTTSDALPTAPLKVIGPIPTVAIDMVPGGGSRVYAVDARALRFKTDSEEPIRRFFLAPVTTHGGTAEIDHVRIVSRAARLIGRGAGSSYETIRGDLRPAAFTAGPRSLEYRLRLPEEPVELSFGMAVLGGGAPVRMSVEILAGGDRAPQFAGHAHPGEPWQDATVDLSAFAGQEIDLLLSSDASSDQVALWASPILRAERERPFNVVVYLEDTLRADHLSSLGYERDTTPVKRAFARDAVSFGSAIAQATKTRPSVASFMTSLPPSATGVVRFWERLDDGYLTLAEVLRHQGFVTAALVQNGNGGEPAGLHQGFDQSLDRETVGDRPAHLVDRVAIPWLRRHASRNFLLYVHVLDPHAPNDPPPPDDEWAQALPDQSPVADRIARYDGEIRMADRAFGRFLGALDDLGLRRDTLIVYLSDHGEYLGEDGRWGHEPPGDPPVIRVPLMLAHPSGLEGGRRIDSPVQLMDLMPTILELAGIETAPLALAGRSLARLARTGRDPAVEERMLVSEEPTGHPLEMRGRADATGSLFFEGWQLQRSRSRGGRLTRWLVGFRPTHWPRGQRDLLLTLDPWTRQRSRSLMLTWQATHLEVWRALASPPREVVAIDPVAQERLRALGYTR